MLVRISTVRSEAKQRMRTHAMSVAVVFPCACDKRDGARPLGVAEHTWFISRVAGPRGDDCR